MFYNYKSGRMHDVILHIFLETLHDWKGVCENSTSLPRASSSTNTKHLTNCIISMIKCHVRKKCVHLDGAKLYNTIDRQQ